MRVPSKLFLSSLLVSCLAACGGSDSSGGPSPVLSAKVTPYLGEWSAACDGRTVERISVTQDPAGGDRALMSTRTDYYAHPGCSGAIIATKSVNVPGMQVEITGSANGGVVFSEGAAAVPSAYDAVSATMPAHRITVTGTAVTYALVHNQWMWHIDFGGDSGTLIVDQYIIPAQPPESGAFMINGGKLYIMSPAGSVHTVDRVYSR